MNVDVGFYVSVIGLGKSPYDTLIGNLQVLNGSAEYVGGALANFWRSAENVYVIPHEAPMTWAVS